jgi:DNA (cytosine-5)-methyltransferase 1
VVDLYAGPGGWDEGMRQVGIRSIGVETDGAACRTAAAAGHLRVRADVPTYAVEAFAGCRGLVASPPCQAWSVAGKRQGELDRPRVHELVDAYAVGGNEPGTGWADGRSHHAAQPVRWVRDLRPEWVALEQVPPILGLWRHIAIVLRRWGYSTWTGVLNSADYGVPQTRERAFLLARLDGAAVPPEPTHARAPGDDLFGGRLEPWVSMAEALGWVGVDRPARTIAGDRSPRWAYPQGNSYATGWTLDRRTNSAGPRGTTVPVAPVPVDRPAPTVTSMTGAQWVLRNGNQDNACERRACEPAGTLFFGQRSNWVGWVRERPATTIQGTPRVGRPGHKDREGGESQFERGALNISIVEAAVLQSFRADYPWQGTKTQQFSQIGNAVPPLLASRIIEALAGSTVSGVAA